MKTRTSILKQRKAFSASDVIDAELKGNHPISFIDVIVRMTNGAAMTEASVVKPHDDVSKIEVIAGGRVLESGNGEDWQAVNAFMMNKLPYQDLTLEDNAIQTEVFRIPFGHYEYDPNHYLRPADFENPEIKVHLTMTTAAATAWAAAGHDVTIIAHIMESGYGDYQGFLGTEFVRSYASVDGTVEDTDLNTDWPYNMIVIAAMKTATRPDENVEIVKLDANDGDHVELDIYMTQLQAENVNQFGPFHQKLAKRTKAAADVIYSDLFLGTMAAVGGGTTLYAQHLLSVDSDQVVSETYAQT